nr:putative reverse transcriptase domain-containing protein [Tanacetum cinerariifolium]
MCCDDSFSCHASRFCLGQGTVFATGRRSFIEPKIGLRMEKTNHRTRVPISLYPCHIEEKMTIKEARRDSVIEWKTKVTTKEAIVIKLPGKFHGYKQVAPVNAVKMGQNQRAYYECGSLDHIRYDCPKWKQEVHFLGHVVNQSGIHVDPSKIEAMKNWKVPTTSSKVRLFLGLAGYFPHFIANFSKIAKPLTSLTQKNQKYKWGEKEEEAFQTLKNNLCVAPILSLPDGIEDFVVYYDASNQGLGCMLMQRGKVIAYASRQLKSHEKNYTRHDLELGVVVFALKTWRHYLYGTKSVIYTNHKSLQHIFDQKELNMRQMRWIKLYSDYECETLYHPGKTNVVVDALSKKERVKPRRVRAMAMTIQFRVKDMILASQSEAFKQENVLVERLHGLDQQMERKEDESLYFIDGILVPFVTPLFVKKMLCHNHSVSSKHS